jgi:hypothetical protein
LGFGAFAYISQPSKRYKHLRLLRAPPPRGSANDFAGHIDTSSNRKAMPNAVTSNWIGPNAIASLIVWLAGDAGETSMGQ